MARKRAGLGRGLNALLPVEDAQIEESKVETEETPVEEPKKPTRTRAPRKPRATAQKKTEPATEDIDDGRNKQSFIVDIEKVVTNPDQPRSHFDAEELEELA